SSLPYDYYKIESYLKDGRIGETALAWCEGREDWEPLNELIPSPDSESSDEKVDDFEKINNLIQKGETEFALDLARGLSCKVLFGKLLENCCFASDGSIHLSDLFSGYRGDITLFFKLLSIAPEGTPLCNTIAKENFTSLKLEDNSSIEELSFLEGFTNLENLELKNCSSLENFEALTKLTNLKTLEITGSGYRSFKDLSSLEDVTITNLSITKCSSLVDVSALSGLPHLDSLRINDCSSLKDISVLSNLPNLRSLNLQGCSSIKDLGSLMSLDNIWSKVLPNQFYPKLTYYERVPQLSSKIYYLTEDFIEESPFESLEELEEAQEEGSEKWDEFLSEINGYYEPDETDEDWQDSIYDEWEYRGPSV
ncbi:MAG: hypothetical protein P8P49_10410, partial [Opitutales bacterium]|nr:hypothetical protein [Opitutales bacterium]